MPVCRHRLRNSARPDWYRSSKARIRTTGRDVVAATGAAAKRLATDRTIVTAAGTAIRIVRTIGATAAALPAAHRGTAHRLRLSWLPQRGCRGWWRHRARLGREA